MVGSQNNGLIHCLHKGVKQPLIGNCDQITQSGVKFPTKNFGLHLKMTPVSPGIILQSYRPTVRRLVNYGLISNQ